MIYDGAPAHRCFRHPRGQYRAGDAPGLQPIPEHIVEQAISSLEAAIKGDVSRPEIQAEARRLGIPLGQIGTQLSLEALQR